MLKHFIKWLLAFVVIFNAGAAYCDWYMGIGAGNSSFDAGSDLSSLEQDVNEIDSFPGIDASIDVEDTDTGFKIFAGKDLSENLSVEFGYIDLGEISADFSLSSDGTLLPAGTDTISGTDSVAGFNIGVVGQLPVSDLISINGRAGLYIWDMDSDFSIQDPIGLFGGGDFSDSESNSGEDIYYGIGLDIGMFGLFYEIYDIDGSDVDLIGASLTFGLN